MNETSKFVRLQQLHLVIMEEMEEGSLADPTIASISETNNVEIPLCFFLVKNCHNKYTETHTRYGKICLSLTSRNVSTKRTRSSRNHVTVTTKVTGCNIWFVKYIFSGHNSKDTYGGEEIVTSGGITEQASHSNSFVWVTVLPHSTHELYSLHDCVLNDVGIPLGSLE